MCCLEYLVCLELYKLSNLYFATSIFNDAMMPFFVAAVCGWNCAQCLINGPGKCDENHCNDGYTYNNETQTYDGT